MSNRSLPLNDPLYDYLIEVSLREPETLRRLRAATAELENSGMQIAPEQGQFMALLVRLLGARRTLEVGTFTGYSALAVALALPEDGKLVACDLNAEWTTIGRRFWEEAGVADRIELRLGPGEETLAALLAAGEAGRFDFAFIDADKQGYDRYYEACLELIRPGGLVAIDNAFRNGRVARKADHDPDTAAIDALNRKVGQDPRVEISLVPIGDGLLLARKSE